MVRVPRPPELPDDPSRAALVSLCLLTRTRCAHPGQGWSQDLREQGQQDLSHRECYWLATDIVTDPDLGRNPSLPRLIAVTEVRRPLRRAWGLLKADGASNNQSLRESLLVAEASRTIS